MKISPHISSGQVGKHDIWKKSKLKKNKFREEKFRQGAANRHFEGKVFRFSFSSPNTQVHFQTEMCNEENINGGKYQSEIIDNHAYLIFNWKRLERN